MNSQNEMRTDSSRSIALPMKVIVSLRAGAVLAVANIICVIIVAWAYTHVKKGPKVISVTGSAKKAILSDLAVWEVKVSVTNPDLVKAYEALKLSTDKTANFLRNQKVGDQEMKASSIWTKKNFSRDEKGNLTDKVVSYDLVETIEVTSGDVNHISDVSRQVTALMKEGVMIESEAPSYLYTKMADLKIEMLAEATKDAATRARQIAVNSGAKLGSVREARMGVMQINAIHSNDVSSSGVNDTSSLEKEITAVVGAEFELD